MTASCRSHQVKHRDDVQVYLILHTRTYMYLHLPTFLLGVPFILLVRECRAVASVIRCWKKGSPNFFKSCNGNFYVKIWLFKIARKYTSPKNWATFVGKIITKKFQKQPNLVTLVTRTREACINRTRLRPKVQPIW